ncbi:hypothetical protein LCGC14_1875130 [marine sediment metagenome]|uniref:Uncharacterized protein n=1 Tax=marine sediment metagenome TaxID=412755 RepID=A0A0F9G3U6_9ZZZZ
MMAGNTCTICDSDRLGYICHCGEMRCSCSGDGCPTCESQQEYEQQQQAYEAEQQDREAFEDEMDRKYG